jgi:hypothetical protein
VIIKNLLKKRSKKNPNKKKRKKDLEEKNTLNNMFVLRLRRLYVNG